jgi:hypothetical protein
MLFAIVLVAGGVGLAEMGLSWLPRILAGVSIALALTSMLPIAVHALGAERVFAWLLSTRLVRDGIDAHHPFELAATLSAVWLSVALRLPGWLGTAGPAAAARFEADLAADGWAKTPTSRCPSTTCSPCGPSRSGCRRAPPRSGSPAHAGMRADGLGELSIRRGRVISRGLGHEVRHIVGGPFRQVDRRSSARSVPHLV